MPDSQGFLPCRVIRGRQHSKNNVGFVANIADTAGLTNGNNETNVLYCMLCAAHERRKAMAVSKSQQKAVHKYVRANYDRMELTVPKGRKELIKAHAEAQGQSVNAYINEAIDEKMSREAVESPTTHVDTLGVSLPCEASKRAPAASEGCTEGIADGG